MDKTIIAFSIVVGLVAVGLIAGLVFLENERTELEKALDRKDSDNALWSIPGRRSGARIYRFVDDIHKNACYVAIGYRGVAIDCLPVGAQ